MAIHLQIVDKDNKILQDDELLVEDGDIVLCQLDNHIVNQKIIAQVSEGLAKAFSKADKDQISPIIYDSRINFKILKIKKDK